MSDRRRTLSGGDLPTGVAEFTWYATKAVSNAILFNFYLNYDGPNPNEIFSSVTVNGTNISIPTTSGKNITYNFPSAGYYKVRIKVKNSTSSKILYLGKHLFNNDSQSSPWTLGDNSTYYCVEANLSGLVFDYTNGIAGFLPAFGERYVPNTKLEHIIMPKVKWTVTAKSWAPNFYGCTALNKISNFKNIDCSGGFSDITGYHETLTNTFADCKSLQELIIENCDFSQGGFPTFSGGTPNMKKYIVKNCKLNVIEVPCPTQNTSENTDWGLLDYSGTNFSYSTTQINGGDSEKRFSAKKVIFKDCIFGKLKTIAIQNDIIEELDFTNCNLSTVTSLKLSGTKLTKLVITGVFNPSSASIYSCQNVTLYYNNDTTYNYFKGKSVSSSWKYVKI